MTICPRCHQAFSSDQEPKCPHGLQDTLSVRRKCGIEGPVGGMEIADRLGVKRETVAMWKQRGLLPPARWTVSGEDAWDWTADIEPWATATKRL